MNKIKFYVSALLVAGIFATGTISCVSDKESDSVQNIRNAKADELRASAALIKAQAEAELIIANADKLYREAEAALKTQEAALKKAEAEYKTAEIEAIKQEMANQLAKFEHEMKMLNLEYELKVEQNKVLAAEERSKLYAKKAEAEGLLKELLGKYINLGRTIDGLENIKNQAKLDILALNGTLITRQIDSVYFVDRFKISTEVNLKTATKNLANSESALAFWTESLNNADATVENLLKEIGSKEEELANEVTKLKELRQIKEEKYTLWDEASSKYTEANKLLTEYENVLAQAIRKSYYTTYKKIEPLEISYANFEKNDDGTYVIKDGKKVPGKCKTTSYYLNTFEPVWDCSAQKEAPSLYDIFSSQKLPENASWNIEDNRCWIYEIVYHYYNNGEIGVSDYEYAIKISETNLKVSKLALNELISQRDAQAIIHTNAAKLAAESYDKLGVANYNLNEAKNKGQDTKNLQKIYDDAYSDYYGYSKDGSYIVGKLELYEFAKNKLQAIQYVVDQQQYLVQRLENDLNTLNEYRIIIDNKKEDLVASVEKTNDAALKAWEVYEEASANALIQYRVKEKLASEIEMLKNQPLKDKDGNPLSSKILSENLKADIENEIYWSNRDILMFTHEVDRYNNILANLAKNATDYYGQDMEYITRVIREQIAEKELLISQTTEEIASKTTEKNNLQKLIDTLQAEFNALTK